MKEDLHLRRISTANSPEAGAILEIVRLPTAQRVAVIAAKSLFDAQSKSDAEIEHLLSLAPCVVMRSGLPRSADQQNDAAAALLAWGPQSRRELDLALEAVIAAASRRSSRILLWPHAREVLSDIPSCLNALRRYSPEHFGLIVQPRDLLTDSMLPSAEEHFVRIFEAFELQPGLFAFADACRIDVATDQPAESPTPDLAAATLKKLLDSTQKPVLRALPKP